MMVRRVLICTAHCLQQPIDVVVSDWSFIYELEPDLRSRHIHFPMQVLHVLDEIDARPATAVDLNKITSHVTFLIP